MQSLDVTTETHLGVLTQSMQVCTIMHKNIHSNLNIREIQTSLKVADISIKLAKHSYWSFDRNEN